MLCYLFCWREIATCKTNMKNMKVTSFTAKKTWSLSLKVTDQAIVPVVTLGLLVLFSRSILTYPCWSWAAGWLMATANWTRSKHLNQDDSFRIFVQRLWNWHWDSWYVFVEELRGIESWGWGGHLNSKVEKDFQRERRVNKVNTPVRVCLAVEWCGIWRQKGRENESCYVTNNF